MSGGFGTIYGTTFADAEMTALFDDHATLQAMLDFEAALALAQAQAGLFPQAVAQSIATACDARLFAPHDIGAGARGAGNAAAPLVKLLMATVARSDPDAARWVHFGATSQDVVDTALMTQVRRARSVIDARLARLAKAVAGRSAQHRDVVMAGRTLLQQATPITFGLKAANWLSPLTGIRRRLDLLELPVLQFGGAVGTLAGLGDKAAEVAERLAKIYATPTSEGQHANPDPDPTLPWHTDRGALCRFGAELGILVAVLAKIATDVALMAQTEIREAAEAAGPGRGTSSTMPHKRNPVLCMTIRAIAQRTPGLVGTLLQCATHEHERALGAWQAEAPTLIELTCLAGAALLHAIDLVEGLEIDPARMLANLRAMGGLAFAERVSLALSPALGRIAAHNIVERACRAVTTQAFPTLAEALLAQPDWNDALTPGALAALFDERGYVGESDRFVEAALAGFHAAFETRSEDIQP